MAIRINYNPMSVLTNANLTRSERLLSQVLDRMSSGERIRRSADDPAAMVVANAVRFHRAGVERASSNAEEAVTMLQTAEGGMDQIQQVLQRMRTLAIGAASTATADPQQLLAMQDELNASVASINTIATSTSFGGISLLDGSLADNSLSDNAKSYYTSAVSDLTLLPGGIRSGSTLSIAPPSGAMTRSNVVESYLPGTPGSTTLTGPGTVSLSGPKGALSIPVSASMTIDGLVSAVNASSATTGIIAGYDQSTGVLQLESTAYGSANFAVSSDFGILGAGPTVASDQAILLDYVDAQGVVQTVTLVQDPTSADGRTFTNPNGGPPEGGPPPYTGFAPGAFKITVADSSGGGLNATIQPASATQTATRTGTTGFQIGALSSQRVTVEIADLRAGALGHSAGLAASGYASLADLVSGTALTSGNADSALQVIDAAIAELSQTRGAAGALQGNTIERVMESLGTSSANLRAYEGTLRDADMAAESSEYARLQIMIQTATAMLAQANQVPQSVLKLLES